MKPLCGRCDAKIEGQPDQDKVAGNVISVPFSDLEEQAIVAMWLKGVKSEEIAFAIKRNEAAIRQVLSRSKYLPKYGPRKRGA